MGRRRILLMGVVVAAGLSTVGLDCYRDYRTDRDLARLRDMLEAASPSHPGYDHLRAVRSDGPEIWIFGTLDSMAQINELRSNVARLFGETDARRIVSQIHLPGGIEAAPKPATAFSSTTNHVVR